MANQIEIKYLGDLRTNSVHLQSSNEIITDAPTDNKGKGEAFSPTDLFVTSLGSCKLTTMGITAQQYGIDIDGAYAKITKIMGTAPRRISEIHVSIFFTKELSSENKKILEISAKNCPVSKSIGSEINVKLSFHYLDY